MIWEILIIFLAISMIYLHEYGHYVYAKKYGDNVQVLYRKIFGICLYPRAISYQFDENKLSVSKRRIITLSGILYGSIPVILIIYYGYLDRDLIFMVILALLYIGCCYNDIKQLIYPKYELCNI